METAVERCCGILGVLGQTKMVVITPDELKRNFPKLVEWVIHRERVCMRIGELLSSKSALDALAIGVGQMLLAKTGSTIG